MCLVNTGLTAFDLQTKFLGLGDVCSTTQLSTYVRGESFVSDIKKFDLQYDQVKLVENFVKNNEICVLYKFFFRKRGQEETIGFVLSNKKEAVSFGARTSKRGVALEKIVEIIKNKEAA